jgi:hypothetical protein
LVNEQKSQLALSLRGLDVAVRAFPEVVLVLVLCALIIVRLGRGLVDKAFHFAAN